MPDKSAILYQSQANEVLMNQILKMTPYNFLDPVEKQISESKWSLYLRHISCWSLLDENDKALLVAAKSEH